MNPTITVATLNMWCEHNPDKDARIISQLWKANMPDIVCLQEAKFLSAQTTPLLLSQYEILIVSDEGESESLAILRLKSSPWRLTRSIQVQRATKAIVTCTRSSLTVSLRHCITKTNVKLSTVHLPGGKLDEQVMHTASSEALRRTKLMPLENLENPDFVMGDLNSSPAEFITDDYKWYITELGWSYDKMAMWNLAPFSWALLGGYLRVKHNLITSCFDVAPDHIFYRPRWQLVRTYHLDMDCHGAQFSDHDGIAATFVVSELSSEYVIVDGEAN